MKKRLILATAIVTAIIGVAACSKPAPPAPPPITAADFNTTVPLNEVMAHVMNPAAFQFWSGWGTRITTEGTLDLAPKNEAEWKYVEDGATTVLMTTNVLKLPGYVREPRAEWNAYANKVAEVATRAKAAAERQDKEAIGTIGEELDQACEACHIRFMPNYQ